MNPLNRCRFNVPEWYSGRVSPSWRLRPAFKISYRQAYRLNLVSTRESFEMERGYVRRIINLWHDLDRADEPDSPVWVSTHLNLTSGRTCGSGRSSGSIDIRGHVTEVFRLITATSLCLGCKDTAAVKSEFFHQVGEQTFQTQPCIELSSLPLRDAIVRWLNFVVTLPITVLKRRNRQRLESIVWADLRLFSAIS